VILKDVLSHGPEEIFESLDVSVRQSKAHSIAGAPIRIMSVELPDATTSPRAKAILSWPTG
jgi:hypothetical protein